MAKDWFIKQTGKTYGPYPPARLKALVADGRISPEAQVSNSPNGSWHPISNVKGLEFPATPAAPPPAPIPADQFPPVPAVPPQTTGSMNADRQRSAQPATSETAVWSGRPSQITNIKTFILCGLFCWLVVPIFIAAWTWLTIRSIRYELTTQRFRNSHGILSRRTEDLELYRIKDSSFSQSLFERIFGLATIVMRTSDPSTPTVSISSISAREAQDVREQIRALTEELRDRKRVREVDYT